MEGDVDIYERLREDHRVVADLLERLWRTTDDQTAERERHFQRLALELSAHSDAEQRVFYDRLERFDETRDLVFEGREEHKLARRLLRELDDLPKDDERWHAKLTVLRENVSHHLDEEESRLFPLARRVLDEATARGLGEEFIFEKRRLSTPTPA